MSSTLPRIAFAAAALFAVVLPHFAFADSAGDVQSQIDGKSAQIEQLQKEIDELQQQLDQTSQQKQTLQGAIQSLTLSRKKLTTQISLTQTQISRADLQIETLSGSIATTSVHIATSTASVAATLRNLDMLDRVPPAVVAMSDGTLSSFFTEIQAVEAVRASLQNRITELSSLKDTLETSKSAAQDKRDELASLKATLGSQQKALDATISSQNQLLAQTKNKESNYQSLIAEKKAQEKQFEQELQDLQKQLTPVTATEVPHPGSGILAWPFSSSVMQHCETLQNALKNPYCVTQYFGKTAFSTANPQVYNGMGHDGIDIGVPIGTPVLAALSGTVIGTGNTDLVRDTRGRQCYSFGKWVMLKHDNGLATLYAHLSSIEVSKGQTLTTGQEVGISGMTGYATGPHLHFGVYASAGVQIMDLGQFRGKGGTPCTDGGAVLPVAPNNAYLNPLSYL